MSSPKFLYLLLADDDADDRMFFEEALDELNLNVDVHFVKDGIELMDYLLASGIILPQIIFLDLNMPLKTGFQCLQEIRSYKAFQDIHIVIYSTTARPSDIQLGFEKGANLFVHKPSSYTELKEILKEVLTKDFLKINPSWEEFIYKYNDGIE